MSRSHTAEGRDRRVRVVMPTRPVTELSSEGLEELIVSASRAETQITALRLRAVAELTRREGRTITYKTLRGETNRSTRDTKREVETARQLQDLPATSRALDNGDISYRHAEIIARSTKQAPNIKEQVLVERAKQQPTDTFAKTARREVLETSGDGMSVLEKQRRGRAASIRLDPTDGMTVLFARFDPVTGARVKQALSQRVEALWRAEHRNNRPTTTQRMADALAELIIADSSSNQETANSGGGRNSTLLLIAEWETVTQQVQNLRLGDNTPLPVGALARLACDAQVVPAFFDRNGQPLWLGRSRRVASPAQRIALVARDRGCVGCDADPSWCQAHHIIPWAEGGATTLDNMCLVCSQCHHQIHDQGWQIRQTPQGRLTLQPPKPT